MTPPRPKTDLWNSVATWRALTAVFMILALASLALALLPRTPTVVVVRQLALPGPIAVARLEARKGAAGDAAFIATFDQARRQLVVTPVGAPAQAGRSAQLWLMPDKGPPASLGVFIGDRPLVVAAPAGVAAASQLGVSLEPAGGSASGRPTGPMVATGKLTQL